MRRILFLMLVVAASLCISNAQVSISGNVQIGPSTTNVNTATNVSGGTANVISLTNTGGTTLGSSGQTQIDASGNIRMGAGGSSSSDVGLSRSAAGVMSVDGSTAGDGKGSIKAAAFSAGSTEADGFVYPSVSQGTTQKVLMSSVWDRLGSIASISAGSCGFQGEMSVIYEGNSQLLGLPATTQVFKATGTGPGLPQNICYGESLDGVSNWVIQSTPLLTSYARSGWLKVGSTYYLYATVQPVQNRVDVFTSSVSSGPYTIVKSGALTLGSSGATILTPGSGQADGTILVTGTGGGCTTAPQIQITVSGGVITAAQSYLAGAGCTSLPTFTVSDGGTPGTVAAVSLTNGGITLPAWDSSTFGSPRVIVDGSTWRMLYEANGLPTSSTVYDQNFLIGAATSSDGLTWAKYSVNPVIGGNGIQAVGSPWWFKDIDGTYWAWVHMVIPGMGPGNVPSDIARFKSTDALGWSQNPMHTMTYPRLEWWEGAFDAAGGLANPTLVEVNGKTYIYTNYFQHQTQVVQPGAAGVEVGVTNMTLHQLVSTDEGATISYAGLPRTQQQQNNWWMQQKVNGAGNLNYPNCAVYDYALGEMNPNDPATQSSSVASNCYMYYDPATHSWNLQRSGASGHGAGGIGLLNFNGNQTTLATGFSPDIRHNSTAGQYAVESAAGNYTYDLCWGKDATTDDFIVTTCGTASPSEIFIGSSVKGFLTKKVSISSSGKQYGSAMSNLFSSQTSLTTGNLPAHYIYSGTGIYALVGAAGNYTYDLCWGKDATTDDFIVTTCNTTTPVVMLRVTSSTGQVVMKPPTSCTGLPSGSLYNNAGTASFCP